MEKVIIGGATLYCGDSLEALRDMADNSFSLAIVDPPYGINAPNMQMGSNCNRKDGWHHGDGTALRLRKGRLNQGAGKLKNRNLQTMAIGWDYEKPPVEYFQHLERACLNRIIWGGNYFDLPPSRGVVCWDKVQPWENFSQWEMAWTSFDRPAALFRYATTGGANSEEKIHPTQKPIALYKWLLSKFAKDGDSVLDTHLGSGSSVIACLDMGFPVTAYEIYRQYFDAACERIERAQQQLKLAL